MGEIRNLIKGTVKKGVRRVEEKVTGKPRMIDEIHRLKAETAAVGQVLQALQDQRRCAAISEEMFTRISSGYRQRYSELLVDLGTKTSEAKQVQGSLEAKVKGLTVEAEVVGQSIVSMASCTAKEARIQLDFLKNRLADVRDEIESSNKTLKFLSEVDSQERISPIPKASSFISAQVER